MICNASEYSRAVKETITRNNCICGLSNIPFPSRPLRERAKPDVYQLDATMGRVGTTEIQELVGRQRKQYIDTRREAGFRTMTRIRIGLALGSGVARGWAHLGVLKAIDRLGLVPDIIAGSSIGALVGGFYLAGNVGQLEAWARRLTKLRMLRYVDLRLGGGVISGNKLFHEAERYLGDVDIESLKAPFVAVATDLWTGHEIWLRDGRLVDAMRASLSLPGVFRPVRMNGHWLIDGALVNPVPVSVCRALGAQMVICVNLNADIIGKSHDGELRAEYDADIPLNGTAGQAARMLKTVTQPPPGNPGTFGVMVSALNIVQDRIARSRLAGEPPDVSINPRIGHIGLLDFHRADELIELGAAAVERAMPEIRDAISVFSSIHG